MRNINRLCLFSFIISTMIIRCGDSNEPSGTVTTDPTTSPCIGMWKARLYFAGITGYDILLDMNVKAKPDTTYSLVGISDSTKDTILVHTGHWVLNTPQDTIFFNGTNCQIIDTTLKQLVARDCQSIPVFINIKNDTWTIKLSDLAPLAIQMNIRIPDALLPALQTIPVVLQKQ